MRLHKIKLSGFKSFVDPTTVLLPTNLTGVVGPNGCGKTTLMNLLPRFWDVGSGAILIDGRDLRDVQIRSLRDQIGMVTQETILFDRCALDRRLEVDLADGAWFLGVESLVFGRAAMGEAVERARAA